MNQSETVDFIREAFKKANFSFDLQTHHDDFVFDLIERTVAEIQPLLPAGIEATQEMDRGVPWIEVIVPVSV